MPDERIRLIVADDHPIVLAGLRELFDRQNDLHVVCCCRTAAETLEALRSRPADVLVLDYRLPDMSGGDVLRAMKAEGIACRTMLLTAALRDNEIVEVIELGVKGLMLKDAAPDAVVDSVRRVHRGLMCIQHQAAGRALERLVQRKEGAAALTPREVEILRLVAEGLRNREVAERLSIAEGTVKIHLHSVYEKLGVDGRLELVLYAQQKGLL